MQAHFLIYLESFVEFTFLMTLSHHLFFSLTKNFTIIYLGRINMFSDLFEMSDIAFKICKDLCLCIYGRKQETSQELSGYSQKGLKD